MKELFVKRESTISLRSKPELLIPSVNSVLKGKNCGSVIWNSLPIEIREDHSTSSFVKNKTMETNCLSMYRITTDPGKPRKPGETLFLQKIFENLEKSGNFFENFGTSWKSRDFLLKFLLILFPVLVYL